MNDPKRLKLSLNKTKNGVGMKRSTNTSSCVAPTRFSKAVDNTVVFSLGLNLNTMPSTSLSAGCSRGTGSVFSPPRGSTKTASVTDPVSFPHPVDGPKVGRKVKARISPAVSSNLFVNKAGTEVRPTTYNMPRDMGGQISGHEESRPHGVVTLACDEVEKSPLYTQMHISVS